MNKKAFALLLLMPALLALGLGACVSEQWVDDPHSSKNSLDWEGVYTGTIPAARGPGINVRMLLNLDETFALRYEYLDRPDHVYLWTGPFKWDKTGYIITLNAKDVPVYYRVDENILTQLDMQGNPITGELADNYILRKEPRGVDEQDFFVSDTYETLQEEELGDQLP